MTEDDETDEQALGEFAKDDKEQARIEIEEESDDMAVDHEEQDEEEEEEEDAPGVMEDAFYLEYDECSDHKQLRRLHARVIWCEWLMGRQLHRVRARLLRRAFIFFRLSARAREGKKRVMVKGSGRARAYARLGAALSES